MVIWPLPWRAYSGMWSATRSSIAERAALGQHVDGECRHRLRGRVDAERGLGGGPDLWRVLVVVRSVAARVPDRPVEHHLALAPKAELQRGVDAASVQAHRRVPDPLDDLGGEPDLRRVGLLSARRRRPEVVGQADAAQRVADHR